MKKLILAFIFALLIGSPIHGENLKEALAFSSFENVSVSKLVSGEIEANRTPTNMQTSMSAETLCFIPKPPEQVVKALMKWDPTSHKDMDIIIHKQFEAPVKESDFDGFSIDTKYDEQRWFLEQSQKESIEDVDLNVSKKDFSRLAKAGEKTSTVHQAWKNILFSRAEAYQKGGLEAVENYQGKSEVFSPKKEIPFFMSRLPKVNAKFKELIKMLKEKDSQAITKEEIKSEEGEKKADSTAASESPKKTDEAIPVAENDALKTIYYWEKMKANNHSGVVLGVIKARQQGDAWQVGDMQYYVSSNYYSSLILYHIIPHHQNGVNGSLLWRGDYILTPEVVSLKGVERVFCDNILIQEVKKAINYFKKDMEK